MRWPTSDDPVNAILSTSGCLTMYSPHVGPKPDRMFTTPGGNPASWTSLPIYLGWYAVMMCTAAFPLLRTMSAVRGVFSELFSTTVQPVARAGPSFQASMSSGKFHGMIWPTTPTGS